jgi:predicted transposase/invertase (TIGR01784 family)
LSHHTVCDVEDGERIIKDMELYFIELPKFNKSLTELVTITDKWIHFIKEAENLNLIPENVDDEGLKAAYYEANKHSWTKEDLEAYDYSEMREQDERGKVQLAEKRGEKRGELRGEEKKETETVLKFHNKGMTDQEISDLLDIPSDRVEQIIDPHRNR